MLKIRLQGTHNDIEWFRRILLEHPNMNLTEFSDEYKNRGTNRYFRVYAEVEPVKAKKKLIN